MTYRSVKQRTYEIVEVAKPGDRVSAIFDIFILTLIFANVTVFVFETVDSVHDRAPGFFYWFDVVSVIIFTVEYLLRIWTCTCDPKHNLVLLGRIHWAMRPLPLIDLLAIAPFYLPFLGIDLRGVRVFRLFRIARIAKLTRYTNAISIITNVVRDRRAELITAFAFLVAVHFIASIAMYFAEHEAQPEKFGSVPQAMWWAVITLTTVGYGDVAPVTVVGKIMGGMIAVLGIAMFALPTSILGAAFLDEVERRRGNRKNLCPHCGKDAFRHQSKE